MLKIAWKNLVFFLGNFFLNLVFFSRLFPLENNPITGKKRNSKNLTPQMTMSRVHKHFNFPNHEALKYL